MGIPKFYRWLTARYPMALENIQKLEDVPPFDHFYLDLNGIFHKCFHGNSQQKLLQTSKLQNYDNLWVHIFAQIDQLVHIVKPRQLLLLAIDGVTPRAKLCQQRARRYRTMRDSVALLSELKQSGQLTESDNLADSNMITPGTWFMTEVSRQIKYFIELKMNTDPLYQKLKIVYSDATVPGEGQHKIMDYIRQFRSGKDYKPNLRHCIYGADADLIMLSLATHQPYFTILREKVEVRKQKHGKIERTKLVATQNFQMLYISVIREYLRLDYRGLEQQISFPWNLQRIIDDFIFICFFVGNDFIPSLLSLDISIGSLDMLIDIYKSVLPEMNGYITYQGEIRWERASQIIKNIGLMEPRVLQMRMKSIQNLDMLQKQHAPQGSAPMKEMQKNIRIKNQKWIKKKLKYEKLKCQGKLQDYMNALKEEKKIPESKDIYLDGENDQEIMDIEEEELEEIDQTPQEQEQKQYKFLKKTVGFQIKEKKKKLVIDYFESQDIPDQDISDVEDNLTAQQIQKMVLGQKIPTDVPMLSSTQGRTLIKMQIQEISKQFEENRDFFSEFCNLYKSDPEAAKSKYYSEKFKIDTKTQEGKKVLDNILFKYLEGLQWVLLYYYRGPPHWGWFYPYHYPPMITDFTNIVRLIQRYYGEVLEEQEQEVKVEEEEIEAQDGEVKEKSEEKQLEQKKEDEKCQGDSSKKGQQQADCKQESEKQNNPDKEEKIGQKLEDKSQDKQEAQKLEPEQILESDKKQEPVQKQETVQKQEHAEIENQQNSKQQSKQQSKQESKQESKQKSKQSTQTTKKPQPSQPKTHVKIIFNFDDPDNMPFQPFLSLLCLMPPTSKDLLPKRFHVAYDESSPIIDLLPSTVEIDLNGRSLPWQAISLVPFIDVERTTEHYQSLISNPNAEAFHPSQLQRNIFHVQTIFSYHPELQSHRDVKSMIKGFPDIPHSKNKVFEFLSNGMPISQEKQPVFKPIKMESFKAQLYTLSSTNTVTTTNFVQPCSDFLTLHRATNSSNYQVGFMKAGKTTLKATTLRLIYKYNEEHEKKLISQFIEHFEKYKNKSRVYIDFPSSRQALLCRIITHQIQYEIVQQRGGRGIYIGQRAPMPGQYNNARKCAAAFANKRGLELDGPICVISYKKLSKVERRLQGGIQKIFSREQQFCPVCLASLKRDPKYFQNLQEIEMNPQKMFKKGEQCLMLDSSALGITSTVVSVSPGSKIKEQGQLYVTMNQETNQQFGDHIFPQEIIQKNWPQFEPQFYTLDDISMEIKIPYKVLAMLTSSVLVSLKGVPGFDDQATNLGLQLKNKNSKVQVADIVIYDERNNSYSFRQDVCDIIYNYKQKFPEVISAIGKHIKKQDHRRSDLGRMHILDIYPAQLDKKELVQGEQDPTEKLQNKVKQIQNWLAELPISNLPFVPLGTFTLPSQVIDKLITTPISFDFKYEQMTGIQASSHYLFNETSPYWMGYAVEEYGQFEMGDRVININSMERNYIKFGLFGTVIGYSSDNKILVLFDEPLFVGFELAPMVNNKSYRLVQVDGKSLINYSQRMRIIEKDQYESYYGFEAVYWKEQGNVDGNYNDDYMSQKWQQDSEGYFYQDNQQYYQQQGYNQQNYQNYHHQPKNYHHHHHQQQNYQQQPNSSQQQGNWQNNWQGKNKTYQKKY